MASKHTDNDRVINSPLAARQLGVWICAASLSLALWLSPVDAAYAQGTDEQRRAAIAEAMTQAGGFGKVLSVKPHEGDNNKPGFRIRILTDGRVRTFDIPAQGS